MRQIGPAGIQVFKVLKVFVPTRATLILEILLILEFPPARVDAFKVFKVLKVLKVFKVFKVFKIFSRARCAQMWPVGAAGTQGFKVFKVFAPKRDTSNRAGGNSRIQSI